MTDTHTSSIVTFGVFQANLRTGELTKTGLRIRIQEQPFKILAALLEKPNEVVTREELRQRIWPRESFGDFDHAIDLAVGKLRTALGDSAGARDLLRPCHGEAIGSSPPQAGQTPLELSALSRPRRA